MVLLNYPKLSFLSGETIELRSVLTAMETLHAAEKYLCDGLMKICANYLANQLNADNVLHIYQRICMYPLATMQQPSQDQPSFLPLEEIDSIESQNTSKESIWCSFLLNCCLEFIDRNARDVLVSEVNSF